MELKGSKTEQNLREAFAGESQARNKYTYFASVAKKEGYQQISAIFEETANNEKEHAKLWFKALGELGDTSANLLAAAEGENADRSHGRLRRMAGICGHLRRGQRGQAAGRGTRKEDGRAGSFRGHRNEKAHRRSREGGRRAGNAARR